MQACGWACRHVGTWMWTAVNKKGKRRKPTWRVGRVDGSVGVWACSRVGMRMRMAVNKKEKRKKHLLIGSERADGRADVQACGHAEADDCKEGKKRKEKGKTHWFSKRADGCVDVLWMGVHGCACGQT